jgi:hypothetical protein
MVRNCSTSWFPICGTAVCLYLQSHHKIASFLLSIAFLSLTFWSCCFLSLFTLISVLHHMLVLSWLKAFAFMLITSMILDEAVARAHKTSSVTCSSEICVPSLLWSRDSSAGCVTYRHWSSSCQYEWLNDKMQTNVFEMTTFKKVEVFWDCNPVVVVFVKKPRILRASPEMRSSSSFISIWNYHRMF